MPPTLVAMTGSPLLMASRMVRGALSVSLQSTSVSMHLSLSGMSLL